MLALLSVSEDENETSETYENVDDSSDRVAEVRYDVPITCANETPVKGADDDEDERDDM